MSGTSAGTITGGDTVTVEGTGFWSTASSPQYPVLVSFCPTGGGRSNSECEGGVGCTTVVKGVTTAPLCLERHTTTHRFHHRYPHCAHTAGQPAGPYYIEVQSYTFTSLPNSSVEFTYTTCTCRSSSP